ncbi:MAG TPA: hypothetical protein VI911_09755 [Patescibacteria group bacterium]|nr:hypothetical protein [Patescibacteria group bacterium]
MADIAKTLARAYLCAVAASPNGIPNGHLYAVFAMQFGATLEDHNIAVRALKDIKMVKEDHFLLTWCGPEDIRAKFASVLDKKGT